MVEEPVIIDPFTIALMDLRDFGDSLAGWVESLDNFDIVIMIKIVMMMFLLSAYQSALMIAMTLSFLERIFSMFFKWAKLILIGAAVTMGIMYACPEAKTSFWNFFGQRSNQ